MRGRNSRTSRIPIEMPGVIVFVRGRVSETPPLDITKRRTHIASIPLNPRAG